MEFNGIPQAGWEKVENICEETVTGVFILVVADQLNLK